MNKIFLMILLASPSAFGQTMYKCPSPTPGAPPIFQQAPCTPQGGGEAVTVKPIPSGAGSGMGPGANDYLDERANARQEQAKAHAEDFRRREAMNVERDKVRAAEEQAAAQRATAAAIWATGRRY